MPWRLPLTGLVAVAVNLALLGVGSVLGVDFEVVSFIGMREETVGVQAVVVMTVVPWALGCILFAVTARHRDRVGPWLAGLGAAFAVVMIPFFNDAEASTKLTLGLMHAVTAALWVHAVLAERASSVGSAPRV